MEILDLHTQFEELVTEMQKLSGATTLIDDNARHSEAVVAQGEEFLSASTRLLQQAHGTVAQAADELTAEAEALRNLQAEIRAAFSTFEASTREHAERIEARIGESLGEQAAAQRTATDQLREASARMVQEVEEAGARSRERLDDIHNGVVQLTKAQRSVSAEIKSGFGKAAQRQAEQAEQAQEALKTVVSDFHVQLAQSTASRLDRLEASLVEQGRIAIDGIQARGGEVQDVTRKAAWAALGLAVLQAGVVVLCFWYFL